MERLLRKNYLTRRLYKFLIDSHFSNHLTMCEQRWLSKGKLRESSPVDSEASLIAKGMQITKLEVSTLSLQGIMTVYKIINCSPSDLVGTGGPTLKHNSFLFFYSVFHVENTVKFSSLKFCVKQFFQVPKCKLTQWNIDGK